MTRCSATGVRRHVAFYTATAIWRFCSTVATSCSAARAVAHGSHTRTRTRVQQLGFFCLFAALFVCLQFCLSVCSRLSMALCAPSPSLGRSGKALLQRRGADSLREHSGGTMPSPTAQARLNGIGHVTLRYTNRRSRPTRGTREYSGLLCEYSGLLVSTQGYSVSTQGYS
jgi:hypothetical protein